MSVKLEPFLKCSVIFTENSKYRHRPFRIKFDAFSLTKIFDMEVVVYADESEVLGENLCRIQIDTVHHKKALIRLSYVPEGEEVRTFWVPREQIEWH